MDLSKLALDELFATIADLLGIAIETVQAHGMEYILMYGRYQAYTKHLWVLAVGIGLGLFIFVIFLAYEDDSNNPDYKEAVHIGFIFLASLLFISAIIYTYTIIPYWVSPEVYSIKEAFQLIK